MFYKVGFFSSIGMYMQATVTMALVVLWNRW